MLNRMEDKCRLLLPGACEPRQPLLEDWASVSMVVTAYAATATGARLSLATVLCAPITVVAHRDKATPLHVRRSCFGPAIPSNEGILVEPPGTAPGSDPLISSAFMSIVPKDIFNIGWAGRDLKG